MSGVTLTLRERPSVPLEAPTVRPDLFAGMAEAEIARMEVWRGKERLSLGDVFEVSGGRSCEVRVRGDLGGTRELGAAMEGGTLVVEGDAGMHTGAGMRGGRLIVEGRVDDWAGAEMTGGVLEVRGDAGDHLAAAYAGSTRGMRGGVVLVHGSAGAQAGRRMRRGVVAVLHHTGPYAGAHMVAGSLLAFGEVGPRPGVGMKRGTVVAGSAQSLLPTFRYACTYRPDFLGLYLRELAEVHGFPVEERFRSGRWRRYAGDFTELGKGEVLVWTG